MLTGRGMVPAAVGPLGRGGGLPLGLGRGVPLGRGQLTPSATPTPSVASSGTPSPAHTPLPSLGRNVPGSQPYVTLNYPFTPEHSSLLLTISVCCC